MLIHPLDRHTTATTITHSTNPFLSSSLDDLSSLVPKYNRRPSLSANTTKNTNPFHYEPIPYNPFSSKDGAILDNQQEQGKEYRRPSHDQRNIHFNQQELKQQQAFEPQTNDIPKEFHKRRMSLDVFKVPFTLNKSRRATCAASDLKRMLTIKTSSVLVRRQQKKEDQGENDLSGTVGGHDNDGADEILKTSRYHPGEQFVDEHVHEQQQQQQFQDTQERYTLEDNGASYQYQHHDTQGCYNPFAQHHQHNNNNRAEHGDNKGIHPFDSVPAQQEDDQYLQQPLFQATNQPPAEQNAANRTCRRYSVFSDWSIEDCPRLLAMQQRQQQEQQREEQELLDRQYQVHTVSNMP
ncbi:hypothetical protein BGX24_000088 [Mortierella sp. AD032]|nr:hypothetical protein BGX24_000088 [Mortierella sp. AD032]